MLDLVIADAPVLCGYKRGRKSFERRRPVLFKPTAEDLP
jgi:hypothetical protein